LFGNSNRLWVLGESNVFQIDATNGTSTGPSVSEVFVYSGSLEISPDRNTLYYGGYGLSPSTMYKIDVSSTNPVLLLQTPFGTIGSNGQDLTISYSGSYICYTVGSGNNSYDIAKFRTSDLSSMAFDANTFLSLGTMSGPDVASKFAADSTGRYLFAGYYAFFSSFMGT